MKHAYAIDTLDAGGTEWRGEHAYPRPPTVERRIITADSADDARELLSRGDFDDLEFHMPVADYLTEYGDLEAINTLYCEGEVVP